MIAIPASLIFLVVLVTTFVGGDTDGADADMDADGDMDGAGFQFFTFKNLVGFFTIFSWSGLACINSGYSSAVVLTVSIGSGLVMMMAMSSLFYFMTRLVEDGTMRIENAIGRTGEVYLPIKANNSGFGKVQINIQGSIHEIRSVTNDGEDLVVGTVVKVVEVIDNHILVVTNKLS
ncbi:MAG: hypothetical protein QNK23_03125 [Crocinitomicaceae bacterium]|nr:hypothetical protein [Crocinitomicaceae bacterium]